MWRNWNPLVEYKIVEAVLQRYNIVIVQPKNSNSEYLLKRKEKTWPDKPVYKCLKQQYS